MSIGAMIRQRTRFRLGYKVLPTTEGDLQLPLIFIQIRFQTSFLGKTTKPWITLGFWETANLPLP